MKKSWKCGLIVGGLAAIVVGAALFFSGYNTGRLPTLPTPLGVVVPPGMRYVGGDEFDGPEGSAPDSLKWKIEAAPFYNIWKQAHPTSLPLHPEEARIANGCLRIHPKGLQRDRLITGTNLLTPIGRISGRIEIRARIVADDKVNGNFDIHLSLFDETGGYAVLKKSHLADANVTDSKEIGFHSCQVDWRAGKISVLHDGNPSDPELLALDEFYFRPTFSDEWLRRLDFLPECIFTKLESSTEDVFSLRKHFFGAQIYWDNLEAKPSDGISLEVDYVRIFQE